MNATGTRKGAYISVNQESTCVGNELRIAILALNLSSILHCGLKLTLFQLEVVPYSILCSCKIGTSDLPDMYTRSLRAHA